jgi:integrase
MTRIRLDFVQSFIDRHGRARHYFRRPGFKRVPLPGMPGSAGFMAAYQAALAGEVAEPVKIGASRTKPGTVNAAIVGFYRATAFLNLQPITKSTYRGVLESFRRKHGDKRIALLERRHIKELLAEKTGKPGAQRNLLRMLKMLLNFAVDAEMRPDNPAAGLKVTGSKGDGFHTWSEDEIARFEAHHALGTRARLAFALMLYTAQRRADVVRVGRQHVRDGVLHVKQSKTGVSLAIPIHPSLAAIIEATPSEHLTFLVTEYGQPFTPAGFGGWFRERCDAAGLPLRCAAHGLRKAACRRLAEAGCSANVIAAISGHKTLREVERYTRAADQARMARTAMTMSTSAFPEGEMRTPTVKPNGKV